MPSGRGRIGVYEGAVLRVHDSVELNVSCWCRRCRRCQQAACHGRGRGSRMEEAVWREAAVRTLQRRSAALVRPLRRIAAADKQTVLSDSFQIN